MTNNEIRERQFSILKKGFSPDEVESFKREVLQYVDSLQNEKADLVKKMEILATKIEEYRQDESSIQEALLGAQKLGKKVLEDAKSQAETLTQAAHHQADEVMNLAKQESEKLIGDSKAVAQELLIKAKSESQKMISEAQQSVDAVIRNTKYDIDKEQANLIRMQKEVSYFKAEVLELYRKHIDLIKDLPEYDVAEQNTRNDEVRHLDKEIYDQKPLEDLDVQETVEFVPEEVIVEAASADKVHFSAAEIDHAKKNVLQDTVEIARENLTRKFGDDLQFGGNHD